MKITSVESFHIAVPYTYGGALAKADALPWRKMETLFVKVSTDEGVVGWGEGFGFATCTITKTAVDKAVAPLVTGRDPRDMAKLNDELAHKLHNCNRNGPVAYAMSAFDIALWDIAGKLAGKPLYQMLGATEKLDRMPAYASLLRYGSADLVRQKSAEAVARGYSRIKLHEIKTDEVAAARQAIGPDIPLMVDTNCPWDTTQAVAMAKAFAPYDLMWLEEPIWPPEDYAALARVRADGGIPVAAGESASTIADFLQLLDTAHVDFIQPSVTKVGGVSQMKEIIAMARARGTAVAPHSPYFGPGLIATIHICASLPERPPAERFYCELEASPLGDHVNVHNGWIGVPNGPGLGVEVDETIIAKYRAS
jgi:D-galactarolactone cycloisomerase